MEDVNIILLAKMRIRIFANMLKKKGKANAQMKVRIRDYAIICDIYEGMALEDIGKKYKLVRNTIQSCVKKIEDRYDIELFTLENDQYTPLPMAEKMYPCFKSVVTEFGERIKIIKKKKR